MGSKSLIAVLFIASLSVACSNGLADLPTELSLTDFADRSVELKDSTSVLICDFRQFNKIVKNKRWEFVLKGRRSNRFYYLDISLPANRELQYIFTFDRLPAVLGLDAEGNINYIEDSEGIRKLEKSKSDYYTGLIKVFLTTTSPNPDILLIKEMENESGLRDSFYVNTLLARAYDKIGRKERADELWRNATSIYERHPDFILERLYIDAMQRLNDTLSHVVITPMDVILENVKTGSETETRIVVSNYGKKAIFTDRSYPIMLLHQGFTPKNCWIWQN